MKNKITPALFVGHGTPMNSIEDNRFSRKWAELGKRLPRPEAILCISAHWETRGTKVTAAEQPATIHDFIGFPRELYIQCYSAPGSPELAEMLTDTIAGIKPDHNRGLDHGTWSVLKHMYPEAGIPIIQLSIDKTKEMRSHYDLGKALGFLRRKGIMIIGSGNLIHNLWLAQPDGNGFNNNFAFDWAIRSNLKMKAGIMSGDFESLTDLRSLGADTGLAIPFEDHYIPLLYVLGTKEPEEHIEIFNDHIIAGSISMTSLVIGS